MRSEKIIGLFVTAALLLASVASAQLLEDYRFKGIIKDGAGNPIADVRITLRETGSGKRIVWTTDDDGTFDRRMIPHGIYQATFEKDGYTPQRKELNWDETSTGTITREAEITMESEAERRAREEAQAQAELGAKRNKLYRESFEALGVNNCQGASKKAKELLEMGAGSWEYATRFVIARCAVQSGDLDGGIAEYRKVIELKPDLFEAQYDLATALEQKQLSDEALVHYGKALELQPSHAEANYTVGAILFRKADFVGAQPYLETAIEVAPDHAAAHKALGFNLLSSPDKDFQRAKQMLSRYLELAADDPQADQIKAIVDGIQ